MSKSYKRGDPDPGGRDEAGRFKKGFSGNPNGFPKALVDIQALARTYTTEAFGTLVGLMRNSEDDNVKLKAAEAVLERAWGKPVQPIDGGNETHWHITLETIKKRKHDEEAKVNFVDDKGISASRNGENGIRPRVTPLSV